MPVTVEFVIEGLEKHISLFSELENLPAFFDKPLGDWAKKLHDDKLAGIANYAPEKADQVYVRSGDLGGGHVVDRYTEAGYRFSNNVDYAPDVLGDSYGRGQGEDFVGRWWTLYGVLSEQLPTAVEALQAYLDQRLGAVQ